MDPLLPPLSSLGSGPGPAPSPLVPRLTVLTTNWLFNRSTILSRQKEYTYYDTTCNMGKNLRQCNNICVFFVEGGRLKQLNHTQSSTSELKILCQFYFALIVYYYALCWLI